MNQIRVYEFSRQLRNPHRNPAGVWVSGGYEGEIGFSNYDGELPFVIQKAVGDNLFRISDSYSPLLKEFSLIAREIVDSRTNTTYAVLAVATELVDDGGRPGVGYRYFWLKDDKSNQIIDSIFTLLKWWETVGNPIFEIEHQGGFLENPFYDAFTYKNTISQHKNNNQIQIYLKTIQNYPYVNCFDNCIKYTEFHHLAWILHQNNKIDQPLAWAWNVPQLQEPQNFILINCVDAQAFQKIASSITSISLNESSLKRSKSNLKKSLSPEQQKIKKLLLSLARSPKLNPTAINSLILFLQRKPDKNWNDWKPIIDQATLRLNSESTAKYFALLALINSREYVNEWLNWLSQHQTYKTISLNFQEKFYARIREINEEVSDNISSEIYRKTAEQLRSFKVQKVDNDQLDWVLQESKGLWKIELNEYSQNLLYELVQSEPDFKTEDSLSQEIRQSLSDLKNLKEISDKQPIYPEYRKLAEFFLEFKKYSLSALFYQLSQGSVPSEIYDQVELDVIPLRRGETTENEDSSLNFVVKWWSHLSSKRIDLIKRGILAKDIPLGKLFINMPRTLLEYRPENKVILAFLAIISLAIGGLYLFSVLSEKIFQNKSAILDENWRQLEKSRGVLLGELKNNNSDLWVKSHFLPSSQSLVSKKPTNFPVKNDSKKEDIYLVQIQLQLVGYDIKKTDGKWNTDTRNSVKKFRKEQGLSDDEIIDRETWNKLNGDLNTKINNGISSVKKFFISSELTKTKKLKLCQQKKKMDEFIGCVDKLPVDFITYFLTL